MLTGCCIYTGECVNDDFHLEILTVMKIFKQLKEGMEVRCVSALFLFIPIISISPQRNAPGFSLYVSHLLIFLYKRQSVLIIIHIFYDTSALLILIKDN